MKGMIEFFFQGTLELQHGKGKKEKEAKQFLLHVMALWPNCFRALKRERELEKGNSLKKLCKHVKNYR